MGRMVGGYNVYQAGVDGCTQGIAVGLLLNGRIALDTCAQRAIVTEREEEWATHASAVICFSESE